MTSSKIAATEKIPIAVAFGMTMCISEAESKNAVLANPWIVNERNRARRALVDGLAYRFLEFRWHRADQHDGVAVLVQLKGLGAEPRADTETGAYLRVHMDFHCEAPDTGSNSKLM